MGLIRFGRLWKPVFDEIFKIQMGLIRFGRLEKTVFYKFFQIQMGLIRFGGLKIRFFTKKINLNGADEVWKTPKIVFSQNL